MLHTTAKHDSDEATALGLPSPVASAATLIRALRAALALLAGPALAATARRTAWGLVCGNAAALARLGSWLRGDDLRPLVTALEDALAAAERAVAADPASLVAVQALSRLAQSRERLRAGVTRPPSNAQSRSWFPSARTIITHPQPAALSSMMMPAAAPDEPPAAAPDHPPALAPAVVAPPATHAPERDLPPQHQPSDAALSGPRANQAPSGRLASVTLPPATPPRGVFDVAQLNHERARRAWGRHQG